MGAEAALGTAASGLSPLSWVGMGLGAVGGISKLLFGSKQNKLADQIHPYFQAYQASPYAQQQLGAAQNAYNGRMGGAASLQQNIGQSQANTIANIDRNATDSATALALAGGAQGVADQSYNNLQTKEAQNKYNLLQNLNDAYATNIREGDKVNQSLFNKFQIDTQTQNALRGAGAQNAFGGIGDLASLGILGGQYASFGNKKIGG